MINWKEEKENLEKYILYDKISYRKIGNIYGCTDSNIKKQAKKLGINLPQKRIINPSETFNKNTGKIKYCLNCGIKISNRNKYCSNKCQSIYTYNQWVNNWKSGKESGLSGNYGISKNLKRYIIEKYQCKCAKCGWNKENPYTHNIPLEIEHIDGNYKNNSEDNLILLCPNCHSLTSTYKGANKGNGRKERKKYNI